MVIDILGSIIKLAIDLIAIALLLGLGVLALIALIMVL